MIAPFPGPAGTGTSAPVEGAEPLITPTIGGPRGRLSGAEIHAGR